MTKQWPKEEFEQKMRANLEDIRLHLDELEAQLNQRDSDFSYADRGSSMASARASVRELSDKVDAHLRVMESIESDDASWSEMRSKVESTWENLKSAVESLDKKFIQL